MLVSSPGPPVNDTKYAQRFKENDYEVVRKDGLVFLREMAAEVKNFMDFKMSAVMVSHLFEIDWRFFPRVESSVGDVCKSWNLKFR